MTDIPIVPQIDRKRATKMNLSEGTILQIAMYIVTACFTAGTIVYRIKALEKRVEKHNNLIERMYAVEQSAKFAHEQIDEIKDALKGVKQRG
jgi:hypothetical protein